ncbi:MAG: trypsin-like serine protease [Paracraurococcus sp.]
MRPHWLDRAAAVLLILATVLPAAAQEAEADLQMMRVMNGSPVGRGEFPSYVALHRNGPSAGTPDGQACGATVIAPRWVLTAAHCVTSPQLGRPPPRSPESLVVVEGRDLGTTLRPDAVRMIGVSRIIVHPDYTVIGKALPGGKIDLIATPFDVALLELSDASSRPAQMLAGVVDRRVLEQPGRGSTVIGFGEIRHDGPRSPVLLKAGLPVVDIDRCRAPRRPAGPEIDQLIGPSQVCAGLVGGEQDSCRGDSGGPLFVAGSGGGAVQIGVVSLGPACTGTVRSYGTYASVAAAAGWIARTVPEASFTRGEPVPEVGPGQANPPPRPGPAPNDKLAGDAGGRPSLDPGRIAQASIDIREGSILRIGSAASFRVVSSIDGLLVILARDPKNVWTQIFPNALAGSNQPGQASQTIRAGQAVIVPGPTDNFILPVSPPAGEGLLLGLVVPDTPQARALLGQYVTLDPIRDPVGYMAALGAAVQASRSLVPEGLPINTALGLRRYTVVP